VLFEASHADDVAAGHEDALLLKQVELVVAHVTDLRFHLLDLIIINLIQKEI